MFYEEYDRDGHAPFGVVLLEQTEVDFPLVADDLRLSERRPMPHVMNGHATLPQVKQRTGIIIAGRRAGGRGGANDSCRRSGRAKTVQHLWVASVAARTFEPSARASEAVRLRHREAQDAGPYGLWHPQRRREAPAQDRVDGRLGCAPRSPPPVCFAANLIPMLPVSARDAVRVYSLHLRAGLDIFAARGPDTPSTLVVGTSEGVLLVYDIVPSSDRAPLLPSRSRSLIC